jgi:hypothetical protein
VRAAQELGLGAIPQAAIAVHSDLVRAHLSISNDQHVPYAVSFGYEDPDHVVNSFRTNPAYHCPRRSTGSSNRPTHRPRTDRSSGSPQEGEARVVSWVEDVAIALRAIDGGDE